MSTHYPTLPYSTARKTILLPALSQLLTSATRRSHGLSEVPRKLSLFVLVCVAFAWIVPTEIAIQTVMFESRRVAGIPVHYIPTAFVFALAILFDSRYFVRLLSRPTVALALACFGFVLAIGLVRYGIGSYMIRSDIYLLRWYVVGVILMRLAIASGMLAPFLVFAALTIGLTASAIDVAVTAGGEIDTAVVRIGSTPLWAAVNCGTIVGSLLLTTTWPKGPLYQVAGVAFFAANFFFGAIRTSTRSAFIVQALAFALAFVVLSRDPRTRGARQGVGRFVSVGILALSGYGLVQITQGRFLQGFTQLGSRFQENAVLGAWEYGTGLARVVEATEMVRGMEVDELLLGRGLGGGFLSVLGSWYNCPHIGVLGWLLKGGFVLLAVAGVTVYLLPATAFAKQLLASSRSRLYPAPILVVGPGLLSWCTLTFLSGGYDNGSLLGLGMLAALWMQLTDDEKVLRADGLRGAVDRAQREPLGHWAPQPAARAFA